MIEISKSKFRCLPTDCARVSAVVLRIRTKFLKDVRDLVHPFSNAEISIVAHIELQVPAPLRTPLTHPKRSNATVIRNVLLSVAAATIPS
jgi:hypothetical protein